MFQSMRTSRIIGDFRRHSKVTIDHRRWLVDICKQQAGSARTPFFDTGRSVLHVEACLESKLGAHSACQEVKRSDNGFVSDDDGCFSLRTVVVNKRLVEMVLYWRKGEL